MTTKPTTGARTQKPMRRHRKVAAFAVAAGLATVGSFALGVGGSSQALATGTTRTASKSTSTNPLPAMSVTDVRTGKAVALQTTLSGKKPLLVWFWAPH